MSVSEPCLSILTLLSIIVRTSWQGELRIAAKAGISWRFRIILSEVEHGLDDGLRLRRVEDAGNSVIGLVQPCTYVGPGDAVYVIDTLRRSR